MTELKDIPFGEEMSPEDGLRLLEGLTDNDQDTIAARYAMVGRIGRLGEGWTARFRKTQTILEKERGEEPEVVLFQLIKDGCIEFTAAVNNMKGTRQKLAQALLDAEEAADLQRQKEGHTQHL